MIGLSVLSGAHMTLFKKLLALLEERDAGDIVVIGGGIIPEGDIPLLKEMGVAEVFTPGARTTAIVDWVRSARRRTTPPALRLTARPQPRCARANSARHLGRTLGQLVGGPRPRIGAAARPARTAARPGRRPASSAGTAPSSSSSTSPHRPTRRRTASASACTRTETWWRWGVARSPRWTNSAASPPGSSRGRNRTPVGRGAAHPVEPEAAPVVPGQVPGDEVPAPADRDQPVRLDRAVHRARRRGCGRRSRTRSSSRQAWARVASTSASHGRSARARPRTPPGPCTTPARRPGAAAGAASPATTLPSARTEVSSMPATMPPAAACRPTTIATASSSSSSSGGIAAPACSW